MKSLLFSWLLTFVLALTIISGCSNSGTPVLPDQIDEPEIESSKDSSRSVIGVYDALIDPVNKTFTIEPATRTSDFHFPLTNLYPNVLQVISYDFGPPFTADIRLIHPFPTSEIIAYDPRVIACLPARTGVSKYFSPKLGIGLPPLREAALPCCHMRRAGSTTSIAVRQAMMPTPVITPSSWNPLKEETPRAKNADAVVTPPMRMARPLCVNASRKAVAWS